MRRHKFDWLFSIIIILLVIGVACFGYIAWDDIHRGNWLHVIIVLSIIIAVFASRNFITSKAKQPEKYKTFFAVVLWGFWGSVAVLAIVGRALMSPKPFYVLVDTTVIALIFVYFIRRIQRIGATLSEEKLQKLNLSPDEAILKIGSSVFFHGGPNDLILWVPSVARASLISAQAISGQLILTNRRLIFLGHLKTSFWSGKSEFTVQSWSLSHIRDVTTILTPTLLPLGLKVTQTEGRDEAFQVYGRKQWIRAIAEQLPNHSKEHLQ